MTASPDLQTLVRTAGTRLGERAFFAIAGAVTRGADFATRVLALAAGLRARGLGDGDRVLVLVHRSCDEAVAILAAAVAGGIAVPANQKLKDAQLRHIVADAEPFAVVASAVRLLAVRDPVGLLRGKRVFAAEGGDLPVPAVPLAALAGDPAGLPLPEAAAPAILLYTSGSTGLPKAVVQTHGNLARGAAIVADYLALTPADHLLALLPMSFDYGLNQLLSALHAGARITVADHLSAAELGELLLRARPTGLAGVPSLWHDVAEALRAGVLRPEHGASLRYVTNSGGALRTADSAVLRGAWPHVAVFAMYGLTEAFRSAFLPPAEFDAAPDSFGRALPGVELLLVDPATDTVVDGPGSGELVHAGALVARGYWRRPEATAERFRPDPRGGGGTVVYSGDLVRRDAAGRLYFVARRDRLLKVQGHRVSPDEVAAAFVGLDGVRDCHVFGRDGGAAGHRIVLVAAGDPADRGLVERLWRQARHALPSYMQPAAIEVVEALPHNANGKVDEAALRALLPPCTDTP